MASRVLPVLFCDVLNCTTRKESGYYQKYNDSKTLRNEAKQVGWRLIRLKEEYGVNLQGKPYVSYPKFDVCPKHTENSFTFAPETKSKKVIGVSST